MGDVLNFVRLAPVPTPGGADFEAMRFRYIASLAAQIATLLERAEAADNPVAADLAERARTIIVGVASMEPTQRERQSLQEMMKTGLPRTA